MLVGEIGPSGDLRQMLDLKSGEFEIRRHRLKYFTEVLNPSIAVR